MSPPNPPMATPTPAKASLWRTVKAVAWSFFGIRNNSESNEDMARVSPFHIIIVGIAGAMIFVLGLVALVNWVVAALAHPPTYRDRQAFERAGEAMSSTAHGTTPYYFVPEPSRHPFMAALGLFFVILGAGQWINGVEWGKYSLFFGMAWWLGVLYQWFRDAVTESEGGLYGHKIDLSFRWSMSWFIFSEVMFFGAFFTALWWARVHSVPALGGLENSLLWPDFKAVWPSLAAGATGSPAGIVEPFQTMGPFWLPTINTALLLTSAVTLTIAHHALQHGQRARTIGFMWLTVILGIVFLCVQGYEYYHAYQDLNLTLASGVYGSTFFMLTGFHGFHVFIGMLMLLFITIRLMKGHFTADRHFGFEGAAWYWHFVDVVWLGLYILVYWM